MDQRLLDLHPPSSPLTPHPLTPSPTSSLHYPSLPHPSPLTLPPSSLRSASFSLSSRSWFGLTSARPRTTALPSASVPSSLRGYCPTPCLQTLCLHPHSPLTMQSLKCTYTCTHVPYIGEFSQGKHGKTDFLGDKP